jgi:hypothetical protein
MRICRRNLPGWAHVPKRQRHALIVVYVWGYWMVVLNTKEGRLKKKEDKKNIYKFYK